MHSFKLSSVSSTRDGWQAVTASRHIRHWQPSQPSRSGPSRCSPTEWQPAVCGRPWLVGFSVVTMSHLQRGSSGIIYLNTIHWQPYNTYNPRPARLIRLRLIRFELYTLVSIIVHCSWKDMMLERDHGCRSGKHIGEGWPGTGAPHIKGPQEIPWPK